MKTLGWSYENVDSCDILPYLKGALKDLEGSLDGSQNLAQRAYKMH